MGLNHSIRTAIFALFVAAVGAFATASNIQAATFTDNFDVGFPDPGWVTNPSSASGFVGTWSVTNQTYNADAPNNGPNAYALAPGTWTDFTVSVDVNNGEDGGIWLRTAVTGDPIGADGILLVFANNQLYFHDVVGGGYGGTFGTVAFVPPSVFNLKVVVSGNQYDAFVNNALTPTTSYTDSGFANGSVGLYSFDAGQSFDNFSISAVPVPAALPLLASALGFFGFVGWRRKRRAIAAA